MTKNFLKLQGPAIGQIVMWPHDRCIKITIQTAHPKLSFGINYDESLPFNCAAIKKVLVEEMEMCASSLGVSFETYAEKPLWSPLLTISAVGATNSMQSNATARIEANQGGHNSFEDESDDEEDDADSDTSAPIFPRPRNPKNPNTDLPQRSIFVIEDNESISGDEFNPESPVLNDQGDFTDGVNAEVAIFQDVIETQDHKKETGGKQLNQSNRESRKVVEVVKVPEKGRDQREMGILKTTNENPSLVYNKGNDTCNSVTDCAVADDGAKYHHFSDSGAWGYQDNCHPQAVSTTKTCKGENQRGSKGKGKHTLGLKGGRRDEFESNLSSLGAVQTYNPETSYFGIEPEFLARHTDDDSMSMKHNSFCLDEAEEKPPLSFCRLPDCQECFSRNTATASTGVRAPPTQTLFYRNSYQPQPSFSYPHNGKCSSPETNANWNLPLPPSPFPYLSCDVPQERYHLAQKDSATGAVQCPTPQFIDRAQGFTPLRRNYNGPGEQNSVMSQTKIKQSELSVTSTSTRQNAASLQAETSATSERGTRQQETQRLDRESASAATLPNTESKIATVHHISDEDSLASLERRVAKAWSLVERVLKEREEREKAMRERERRQREERARREQRERERREREERQRNQSGEGTSTGSEEETPSQHAALPENKRWLCEHYQRLCRVKFPCCGRFYPCHRCHNNSDQCDNDNCKAKEGIYIECSICRNQQPIDQGAQTCAKCKTKMSAYFCAICKHFTGEDKNPYHCTKCGICRIHKDRSYHCDVCNVCLDKRLQGKHQCRPNSGHDECCICLEDAFSGCQILPCSHKVHRECAIAMIQNGVRSCPICRHPLYSQTGGTE